MRIVRDFVLVVHLQKLLKDTQKLLKDTQKLRHQILTPFRRVFFLKKKIGTGIISLFYISP